MSPLVLSVPHPARVDHASLLGHAGPRLCRGPLLTKRRSVDFGRVATSLCRCA